LSLEERAQTDLLSDQAAWLELGLQQVQDQVEAVLGDFELANYSTPAKAPGVEARQFVRSISHPRVNSRFSSRKWRQTLASNARPIGWAMAAGLKRR
jgi:hypothetical protein